MMSALLASVSFSVKMGLLPQDPAQLLRGIRERNVCGGADMQHSQGTHFGHLVSLLLRAEAAAPSPRADGLPVIGKQA